MKISAAEAKQMMDTDNTLVILDVRTNVEYMQGHIANSLQIDVKRLAKEVEGQLTNKDQKILIYCGSGYRSAKAAKIMMKKGYTQIYDIEGGIMSWPYEIVR